MRKNIKYQKLNIKIVLSTILFLIFLSPFNIFSQIKIGAALPLFQDSDDATKKQLGQDILSGINFALKEYSKNNVVKVTLEVKDTRRDMTEVVRVMEDFAADKDVQCVIGPVFSSELAEVSNFGRSDLIPIISPTATGDDLAENHDYIFQLNPSYKVRGRVMADYLVKTLGMKNFAVIAEETYGVNFSKHFEEQAKKNGGVIVSSLTYKKDAKNINDIVAEIDKVIKANDLFVNISNLNLTQTKKLESAGVRYSLIDSLIQQKIEVSIYYLLGKNAKKMLDTMNIKPATLKSDAAKYIQGYLDAIYIPISNASEISLIVPELYSNNLSFFFAGTGDWNNEDVLKENKAYFKNLVFESEYYLYENSPDLIDLKAKLDKAKIKLNKNFLFGYDSMNLLLSIIASGNKTRQDIYSTLNKVSNYDAIKSKISLDFNRINSELNILTYNNGIERITQFKLYK